MSIKRSKGLEQSQQQDDLLVTPMSPQQEQQHLQLYWHSNDNNSSSSSNSSNNSNDGSTWTQDDEEKVLHAWASRTFSATCYKFTIQNDPVARQQTPLYSFLENWQLHTMYNKSQKVLLGITDRRPCVLLTGDDFMFTPPPLAKGEEENDDDDDRNKPISLYQQARMTYLEDEGEEDDDISGVGHGDTSGGNGIGRGAGGVGIDKQRWMLYYQPTTTTTTFSPLHVVNANDNDDDDDDDENENENDEQEIMVMGRDTRTIDPPLISPALVKWYQTVERPTITNMIQQQQQQQQQRRPSTILMTTPHYDDDDPIPISHTDDRTSATWISESGNKEDDMTPTTTTSTISSSSSTITTASKTIKVVSWRQWLQQGVIFLSQRMVEVAYMVAELAESFATHNTTAVAASSSIQNHPNFLMTHPNYQDGVTIKASSSNGGGGGGHYIVQLFRVWRVFFLGVETMMHRLFSLDASSSSPTIAILPLVTKSSL